MSKNLNDLKDLLFVQLERISNPELKGDELDAEIKRAETACKISGQIIGSANTQLSALKFMDNAMDANLKLPPVISG